MDSMFSVYLNEQIIEEHYKYTGKLNGTSGDKYKTGLKPDAIAFLLVCLLIVAENAVVLIAIWKNKKFHIPMYYLLGNLTLSDLLAGLTYMINIMTSGANTMNMTPLLYFLREGCVFITLAASIISLLAIAIERHVTMVRMKPYQGHKQGRMLALILCSWVLSVFLGVLPVLGWNCIWQLNKCSTVLPLYAKSYILFCITVFSAVLMSIVVLYVRIFRIVKSNTQRLATVPQRKGLYRKSQKYMALLKTVTIVLGVFIACWMPLFILFLLDFSCPINECKVLFKADYFLGLAVLNSFLNPIIYTLTSKDMRKAILKLLCHRCLLTADGRMKKFGLAFLDFSTTKTDATSHRLEGMETTVSSANLPSTIKAIYPRISKI
ncbi:PREDICTED: sphingosine 1-phosphate receptor 1-like [Cyprinodon variegatus]|uniref:Sphingosine-1-phosphate receptor 5a n=1 Tax=Cyprinodon variegatus TaxID=28743 RepID=A0A3Q2C921_CYPVA|nr:PREDICTED: sphingosine 1-phosphate receptor 1-like [Cyprinodon variegatus]XP_015245880.1 PREDICTED: sphingosine 1-phosphate receptor 1-like [Cyprinodon variegatus]